ncbi:MAG TPA: efflux RND transporter permease subunit [Pseudomonadota bacterium]|nr:efflux RND transporter permease subunit [Pseudomonadota bacterium]
MTQLSLRNPIAILMLSIALIVFSAVVVPRLGVDTFPELTPPVLVVGTLASGLGPKDVEKTISWRIEKYVSATPGVDHVQSVSRNNLSVVYVWLKWGTDLNAAQTLVQQQVAFAMAAVPKSLGVLPPFVLQYDPSNAPVIQVAVLGEGFTGPQIYDYAQNVIEPIIEGIPGVASASPNGGRQRQINIVVDPVASQARGVSSSDLAQVVAQTNALLPSGRFISERFDANVYTNAVPDRVKAIGEAVVKLKQGKPVLLRDVAKVEDGGAPETQAVSLDGREAVYLNVLRVPGGNTIQIVDSVKKILANLQGTLPKGMEVFPIFDQSTFVRSSYQGLRSEVMLAMGLVSLVILIFLQNLRAVLVAMFSIPIAFATILLTLYATGQTLNAFTLGGLTLAMGPLVDISVVVLESIHRYRNTGLSDEEAALKGANAVALPALAATLTTVAVLLPVLLLAGLAKKLFAPLALTVATGMFAGYFISLTVTPLGCRYVLGHGEPGRLARWFSDKTQGLAEAYAGLLRRVLPHRFWVLGSALVLVAASVSIAVRLPSTFFPEIDESMERIYFRLAPGTSLPQSVKVARDMEALLRKELPADTYTHFLMNVGSSQNARAAMNSPNAGPHMGFLRIELTDPEHRTATQHELSRTIRATLSRHFPGIDFQQEPGGLVARVFGNGYPAPIVVEVRGDSLEDLAAQSVAVAEVGRTVTGLVDVTPTFQLDYPEVRVNIDRTSAGMVGVQLRGAAQATLEATLGNINTPSVWVDGGNGQSYYVVTGYSPKAVNDPNALSRIPLRMSAKGETVPLGAYGTIRRSVGPLFVERNQLTRVATINFQTDGRDIGTAAAELEGKLRTQPKTASLKWSFVGQIDLLRTTFGGLGVAILLAVMVVFMIMASQFHSLRLPFIMLFTIPVSLLGIVLALLSAKQGFSIPALMGMLLVVGIAVSNGILLIDAASLEVSAGYDVAEAVVRAARVRFIPIAMTSLATIIGLLPTALGLEQAAASNRPLALAVVGGLTSSTLLSLFLLPCLFTLVSGKPKTTPEPAPWVPEKTDEVP